MSHTILFHPNGLTSVGLDNEQVPELQQSWLRMYLQFLEEHGVDPCACEIIMPDGVRAYAVRLPGGELSWRF